MNNYSGDLGKPTLDDLRGHHKGEHGVLFCCGPSVKEHKPSDIKKFSEGKPLFFVKQTWNTLGYLFEDKHVQLKGFHFWNCCNLPVAKEGKHYDYDRCKHPIVVSSSTYKFGEKWSAKHQYVDFFFKIPHFQGIHKTICGSEDFDRMLFSHKTRLVGPGILFETVFPMIIHLGLAKLTCIGWDLTTSKSKDDYKHYYTGKVYNPGHHDKIGIEVTLSCIPVFYKWCRSYNLELEIASNQSSIDKCVPRICLTK